MRRLGDVLPPAIVVEGAATYAEKMALPRGVELQVQLLDVAADHAGHHPPAATAPAPAGTADAAPLSEGEVRRLDPAQGKITLRHGPLANLAMPAMTMVFKVSNAAWLDQMKTGDKIRFMADNVNGAITDNDIGTPNFFKNLIALENKIRTRG